jgi:hypothetical protein
MGWVGAGCNVKSDEDALESDMHRLLGFLEAGPSAADQDVLERLLDGRLDPGSAPPDYRGLARLLAAAAAPAGPEELAGEQLAMATFAAEMRSHPPILSPRRTAVVSKVFTMKAAAAALVAVLSIGGIAAAATGLLPDQASPVADKAAATTADAAGHGLGKAAVANTGGTAPAGSTDGQGRESAVGPDASGAARAGLCRAWQAGQGGDHGRRMDSVAFQALVTAAGGADKVAAYCEDVAAGASAEDHGKGQGSPPSVSAPPTTVAPPSSGPPADPGPPASTGPGGHGQGGPPTTTG